MSLPRILLYGYGNLGRQDDGLGNEFIERIKSWAKINKNACFEFDSNYQLNIEDAELISTKDLIVFIDASKDENLECFNLEKVSTSANISFTTHSASPGFILQLCENIFSKTPPTYLLHIKGYLWDLKEGLSKQAEENINSALAFMKKRLKNPSELIDNYFNPL